MCIPWNLKEIENMNPLGIDKSNNERIISLLSIFAISTVD